MVFDGPGSGIAFLLGRVLFVGILWYLAIGNLRSLNETVGYAESKGAPMPALSVPFVSLMLIAGGLSILVGAYPFIGAGAVIAFLLAITPVMHDFWNQEGMDRQNERIHFLKNVGLLGGALVFLVLAEVSWPYALNMAL